MANKKMASLTDQAVSDSTRFFREYTGTSNKWSMSTGTQISTYIKTKINESDYVTVGTGGTYATMELAFAASKFIIRLVSNVTLASNKAISALTIIDLNNYTLTCGVYYFNTTSNMLYIKGNNGTITFEKIATEILFSTSFTNNNLIVEDCNITKIGLFGWISNKGTFRNVYVTNPGGALFGANITPYPFKGILENVTINGTGATALVMITDATVGAVMRGCILSGTFSTTVSIISTYVDITDLYVSSASNITITGYSINGLYKIAGAGTLFLEDCRYLNNVTFTTCKFTSSGTNKMLNCTGGNLTSWASGLCTIIINNCNIGTYSDNVAATFDHVYEIKDCRFSGNVNLVKAGAGSVFSGNKITGTLTTVAAAQYNIMTDNIISSTVAIGHTNCDFSGKIGGTLSITGNYNKITNSIITGATTFSADYCKFSNNECTGAVTLSAGSEYNVITGNTFTGGLTDSSASATNEINNNIG